MQKIALVGSFWFASLEESYARAFLELGWDVVRVELESQSLNKGIAQLPGVRKLLRPIRVGVVARELEELVRIEKPDIVLVFKGLEVGLEALTRMKRASDIPIANFNPDSPWEPRNTSFALRSALATYDHHFVWSRNLLARFKAAGARSVSYLPFGYDPNLHYPVDGPIEPEKCEFDAVFLGTYDPIRDKLLGALSRCNIAVWGNDWKRANYVDSGWIKGEALYGADGVRAMRKGRVALNILRQQNVGSHNMRTFEIPATRLPMLTTRSQEQSELFVEGKEMLCYDTAEELLETLLSLRSNHGGLRELAQSAYQRVLPHTYTARAATIISTLQALQSNPESLEATSAQ